MIQVKILINGDVIKEVTAINQAKKIGEYTLYRTEDGINITHIREKGAVELAKKMLDTLETKPTYSFKRIDNGD